MSKRAAEVQLTADNVDQQDEIQEEAGEFQVASESEIQQRVIKKAKRGRTVDQDKLTSTGGIFASLKQSLGASSSSQPSTSTGTAKLTLGATTFGQALSGGPLSGLKPSVGVSSSAPALSGLKLGLGAGLAPANGRPQFKLTTPTTSSGEAASAPFKLDPTSGSSHPPGGSHTSSPPLRSSEYMQQLASLNTSVSQWIRKHVDSNPYVDLTPIFRDYTTHLHNIDTKYGSSTMETEEGEESDEAEPVVKLGSCDVVQVSQDGDKGSQNKETPSSTIEDEEKSSCTSDDPMQSRPSSSQPSSSAPSPLSVAPSNDAQPPDDSLYTVKSKLFYKKGSEFIEVGVGILKVQSSSSEGMVHLLMRNDTSIGNIMLNVKVSATMPLSTRKNSVLLVCPAPNPMLGGMEEGPITYLLRVKTAESAEQLVSTIKENTKESK